MNGNDNLKITYDCLACKQAIKVLRTIKRDKK
jgi:hypothetical protein